MRAGAFSGCLGGVACFEFYCAGVDLYISGDVVRSVDVDAVIVPGIKHLDGQVPAELMAVADVITVCPEETFARWIIPPDAPADMGSR